MNFFTVFLPSWFMLVYADQYIRGRTFKAALFSKCWRLCSSSCGNLKWHSKVCLFHLQKQFFCSLPATRQSTLNLTKYASKFCKDEKTFDSKERKTSIIPLHLSAIQHSSPSSLSFVCCCSFHLTGFKVACWKDWKKKGLTFSTIFCLIIIIIIITTHNVSTVTENTYKKGR